HLYWLFNCAWLCQAAHVAARLDIAERLRDGPLTARELAAQCGAQETQLLQVLRALAGFGVFSQDAQGRFRLNAQAEPLLHNAAFSLRSYAIVWGDQLYPAAGQMLEQVRTGKTGFEVAHGQTIWNFYEHHQPESDAFDTFMSDATNLHVRSITQAYRFSQHRRVVDVGAGRGSLITAILKASPDLQGTWYDRPEVLPEAQQRVAREGVSNRCELMPGNFLESVPSGADLYVIKHVLHDWADEPAQRIIGNIAQAMGAGSKMMIIEAVLDERDSVDGLGKMRDLEQMFWTGGRVRTRAEFERILAPSQLTITKITRTPIIDVCLIEIERRIG
ncbi:MAG TPA: methyltransferase, partial [Pirellulaceae bacterium]|nr:methyltransferase [Pirellulaceae bacterium]